VNCEQANETLTLDLYGEAGEADVAALKAHLAGCPACRRVAEATRAALVEFRRQPSSQPSRDTIEAVIEAAHRRPIFAGFFAQLRPVLWQAATVMAVALIVSVAIRFWPQTPVQHTTRVSPAAAQLAAETSWDDDSAALADRIQLARADVTIGSSLDNRITGLRDALSDLRAGSTSF
jgi:predicted anti-sigma-YlaC factor YlaD